MSSGLFTGKGSFSHSNENLLAALRAERREMYWFDTQSAVDNVRTVALGVALGLRRSPALAKSPRRLYHSRIQTTAAFDAMSMAARGAGDALGVEFVLQTQGLFNARREGRPFFIYTDYTELANHQVDRPYRVAPSSWLQRERRLYSEADRIFAGSRAAHESLLHDYDIGSDRVSLVQTGLNVPIPSQVPERSADAFDVLFIGIDWERKGGPDALGAFAILRRSWPDARLRVVGPRPDSAAPPGVSFLGRLTPAQVSRELRNASVLCLPALHEPAGIAYSEASAWGLPVVATLTGNIPDRVVDGETGLLVTPGDRPALAHALLTLAQDPALRQRLGQAGRQFTMSRFTWSHIASLMWREMRLFLPAIDAG